MTPPSDRQHVRVFGAAEVAVREGGRELGVFMTKNMSMGGLFLLTDRRWNMGQTLEIELRFQGLAEASRAKVTHIQGDGVGFAFVTPELEFQKLIEFCLGEMILGGANFDESRHGPRVPAHERIVWRIEHLQHESILGDISLEGAYIRCEERPEIGTNVYVYLPASPSPQGMPPNEIRGTDAVVMHQRDDGFGVRFVNPSAEFRMAVSQLIVNVRA